MLKALIEALPQSKENRPIIDLRKTDSFTFEAARLVRDQGLSIEKAVSQAIDNRLLIGKPISLRAKEEALVIESLALSDVFTIESLERFFIGNEKREGYHG